MRSIAQAIALLLITSATALPKNPGEPWLTTTVYTTDGGGSTSLAFTPDGHPAIAFNEDYDLIYGVFDGEAWAFTRLGGVEGEITLAFTPSGQPAICHVDLDGDIGEELVLRYTEFDGATWSTDILGEVAGEACSLAFTPQGDPAVSYFAPGGDLIYAVFDGGAWQYSTIDSGGDSSGSTSLGFTPGGQPAIGYCINDIKYAVFDGASWAISTVEDLVSTPLSHSGRTSLAFSPEGWPAISFYDDPSGSIRYAISDGETWSITPIDSAQADARTTLAFAPDSGQPAVSYSDSASRTVRYARLDGSVWSVATADRGAYASLAFTPAGLPAISVQDDDDESVRYSVGTSDSLAAKNRVFNFPLTTDQVVPAPTVEGDATPSGSARVVVNSETGGFAVSGIFGGMTRGSEANSGVIAASLNGFADPGQAAPQLLPLSIDYSWDTMEPPKLDLTSGTFGGNSTLTPVQLTELLSGRMYLTVSTWENQDGEIRGQIAPSKLQGFRITGIERPTDTGVVTIIFTSEPGREYEVQSGADLRSLSKLADAIGADDASETTLDLPMIALPSQYYRVLAK